MLRSLVEGIRAVWASLQVESALWDRRTVVHRRFVAPRWRPQLVQLSAGIVYTAPSSGRPRHSLLAPEVSGASQVFNRPRGCPPKRGTVRAGTLRHNPLRRLVSQGAAAGTGVCVGAVTPTSYFLGPAGARASAPGRKSPGSAHPGRVGPRRVWITVARLSSGLQQLQGRNPGRRSSP
ncbi:hypothetical protein NDU88_007653 [Pleurodeles waltl]|uniref:Uncharacterized protein n=1 Tax=Pleurodeles waltl TaxID=8319 RepID=A0AAV7NC17_PLEWA|nr:hypothetical protein NDU88_007653 [Pleurodeles waltl]